MEPPSSTSRNTGCKRFFDLTRLGVAGTPLAPLWLTVPVAVAVAIRLDDGGPLSTRNHGSSAMLARSPVPDGNCTEVR